MLAISISYFLKFHLSDHQWFLTRPLLSSGWQGFSCNCPLAFLAFSGFSMPALIYLSFRYKLHDISNCYDYRSKMLLSNPVTEFGLIELDFLGVLYYLLDKWPMSKICWIMFLIDVSFLQIETDVLPSCQKDLFWSAIMASTKDPYAQGTRPSVQTETNVTVSYHYLPLLFIYVFWKKKK